MELPTLLPVEYQGELVALVSERRIHVVAPWLLVRPFGDPHLRFVALMCACAGEVLAGRIREPFSSELAAAWARRALIDSHYLSECAGATDVELAGDLNVPLEQVQIARRERPGTAESRM